LQDQTGILVEPRNVSALSAAILHVLNDKALAQTLAAAGVERVRKHFTADSMARKYVDVYCQVLSSKSSMLTVDQQQV
jgi:glycosyltransferase involved in cell wall biosynthesis